MVLRPEGPARWRGGRRGDLHGDPDDRHRRRARRHPHVVHHRAVRPGLGGARPDACRSPAMKIAVTGGTGFVGRRVVARLRSAGHEVVALGRGADPERGVAGCAAVVHCAGINREIGRQTYRAVHLEYTARVVAAARRAGVRRIVMLSFLRARPDCGSAYHESKWAAEEIVRRSGLDYTILKAGMVYGLGDHMLDYLTHALHTFPFFAMAALKETDIRRLAIDDLVTRLC